ncbi:phosphatidylinositol N-acetylglucosaminyltransferase subunit A [Nematocida sp. LUAm3]|nr:phosphatidylinositol N-acetylglucosaminyltransferase subunit A [Nematocida sp. LUAm3]KAI5173975.1 phosphatidylinositol N-acetylglucosaminyltransferase subunit A [Nematocida sp. LUAm2]KAI5177280.1 phosphatidylinositol N-acetylglucosaminyltransferase subunit A [Nematocida sp. LUAm1]
MGYRIAMISDFFYPRKGGVENHIMNLSKELRKIGHDVIIITHAIGERKGIMQVEGFKTYYLELLSIYGGAVFPTFLSSSMSVCKILLQERIEIVHGHQCTTLAMEGLFYGKILGIPGCFTNHSLVKVNTIGGVLSATGLQMSMIDIDQIICVSQASRVNTAERLEISVEQIEVIPNAVPEDFFPEREEEQKDEIRIAVISRLTYRKGALLLAEILSSICQLDPRIRVVIAGEGDKKEFLEQTVDLHRLEGQVTFLGEIEEQEVKRVLNSSHLFLNTSLTEAFCISILEAAACGLYVISTNVDGISEVLPKDMISLSSPAPGDLLGKVKEALPKSHTYNRELSCKRVRSIYSWRSIAKKTNNIYERIFKKQKDFYLPKRERFLKSFKKMYEKRRNFNFSFIFLFFINFFFINFLLKKYESKGKSSSMY